MLDRSIVDNKLLLYVCLQFSAMGRKTNDENVSQYMNWLRRIWFIKLFGPVILESSTCLGRV